jgi:FKBP-type peptidyl-prolyl cis-trans isomerase (trigger factor)
LVSKPLDAPRPAQTGDILVYTMEYSDKNGKTNQVKGEFRLGSGMLPAEFEEALEGIEPGHVLTEKLKVPAGFPDKTLAGKKIDFSIAFHEICQAVPAQVDEEFAKAQGFAGLEALGQDVSKRLEFFGQNVASRLRQRQLANGLLQQMSFDIAPSILEDTVAAMVAEQAKASRAESGAASSSARISAHQDSEDEGLGSVQKNSAEDLVFADQADQSQSSLSDSALDRDAGAPSDDLTQDRMLAEGNPLTDLPVAGTADPEAIAQKALKFERLKAITRKIMREQQIEAGQEQLLRAFYQIAQHENESIDSVINFFRNDRNAMDGLRNQLAQENAMQWMCDQCAQNPQTLTVGQLRAQLDQMEVL